MATTQPVPTPTDAEMEAPGELESPAEDTSDSYTIEITVSSGGQDIKVSVETADAEASESAEGASEQGEDYQSCASIEEALRLVKEIYKAGGEKQNVGADAEAMNSGYR